MCGDFDFVRIIARYACTRLSGQRINGHTVALGPVGGAGSID